MEHVWWVLIKDKKHGPMVIQDVLALLENNRSEACVWREGYKEWRIPDNVPEITVREILSELCALLSTRDDNERSSNVG